jgi:formamidase
MPEVVFPLDNSKKFTEQQIIGHNRWHPDIPAQVQVKPGPFTTMIPPRTY